MGVSLIIFGNHIFIINKNIMKHLLNDLTEEEKNSIRGQHTGGMNVVTENFSKLINTKSGDAKPFLNENAINEGRTPSNDLVTLLYSLRNSINDDDKAQSMDIIDELLSIARDMENKGNRPSLSDKNIVDAKPLRFR
jgi:hypothetical protein